MRRFLVTVVFLVVPLLASAQSAANLFVPERREVYRNPALLLVDEQQSFVQVSPSLSSVSGGLRLPYDPTSFDSYQVSSRMVRVLGDKGTFRASASYAYQQRRNVWSSLRLDPYRGDGFFAVDTMPGSTRYSGPAVQFEYAYQLLPDLAIGFLGSYRVLDGLKDRFTNALTDFRAIRFGAGVEYRIAANDRVGLMLVGIDDQEKIESKSSDDLKDVQVYSYRGETYATRRRSMTLSEVFRTKGFETALDFCINPASALNLSGTVRFSLCGFRSLFPSGLLVEFEDGYAQEQLYGGELTALWRMADDLSLHMSLAADQHDSWSRISSHQLLFWEWNAGQADAKVELQYRLDEKTQLRAAALSGVLSVDSSKYIDARTRSIHCSRFGGEIGCETKLSGTMSSRFEALVWSSRFDPLMGGEDILVLDLSASVSYAPTPQMNLTLTCFGGTASGRLFGVTERRARGGMSFSIRVLQP